MFIGLSVSTISCKNRQTNELTAEELKAEEARLDSIALHVGIYPSEVCLPFYYAEATGIYKELGVDIRFLHLNSMEDSDTALIASHAEVVATDIARLICLQKNGLLFKAIATMNGSIRLLAAKDKDIKDIKQLKERLLALDRHSETDYLSDILTEKRELEHLDVFRTQFNQHKIRFDMINNGLVDAAFLDEPWASIAEENGASSMWKRDKETPWTILATNEEFLSDTTRITQITKLIEGYNIAVQRLNKGEQPERYDSILVYGYSIPYEAVDTIENIHLPVNKFKPLSHVSDSIVQVATAWLINRKWINPNQNTKYLTSDKFISNK